jgi:hypothetical protein
MTTPGKAGPHEVKGVRSPESAVVALPGAAQLARCIKKPTKDPQDEQSICLLCA